MENLLEKPESIYGQLQGIYQQDPKKFDRLSRDLIRKALDGIPEGFRAKAYGTQRRVEHQLMKYKDPVARLNAMVEIFWRQIYEFIAVVHDPREVLEKQRCSGPPAKTIPFKRPDLHD